MMPIVFWASLEPWAKAMYAGGDHLEPAEPIVQSACGAALPEDVQQHDHEAEARS